MDIDILEDGTRNAIDEGAPQVDYQDGGGIGIIGTALMKVVNFFGKIVSVFGGLPRGDYQKFMRVLYPGMLTKAQDTQLAVRALWFLGEIIEVRPSGDFGVIEKNRTFSTMLRFYEDLAAAGDRFYGVYCGTDIPQTPEEFNRICKFVYYGPKFIKGKDPEKPIIIVDGVEPIEQASMTPLVIIGLLILGTVVAVAMGAFKGKGG